MQSRPVDREAGRAVRERPGRSHSVAQLAEVRPPLPAAHALAAGGNEREDDVVACREPLDAGAGLDHDPGGLVAEHERQRLGQVAVDDVEVAMAHAARRDADERFARLRRFELHVPDVHRSAGLPQDGCLHPHPAERTGWPS
jgi:hypothetical protein